MAIPSAAPCVPGINKEFGANGSDEEERGGSVTHSDDGASKDTQPINWVLVAKEEYEEMERCHKRCQTENEVLKDYNAELKRTVGILLKMNATQSDAIEHMRPAVRYLTRTNKGPYRVDQKKNDKKKHGKKKDDKKKQVKKKQVKKDQVKKKEELKMDHCDSDSTIELLGNSNDCEESD